MIRNVFVVDRSEAKLMGVCAGIGNHVGVDATVIRIGFVVATIVGGWPWTVLAYIVLGIVGQPKRRLNARRRLEERPIRADDMRDLDRRLAEIDTYVANSNGRLARAIDELR